MKRISSLRAVALASLLSVSPLGLHVQAAVPNAFDVTGEWQVQPGQASAEGGIAPCMLSNSYDNGFTVKLSGGQNQILVMAVDFKQNIFDTAQNYATDLRTDTGFTARVEGKPFSQSVLLYSVKNEPSLFDALKAGQTMTLDVSGNSLPFSLKHLASGLDALNKCASVPASSAPTSIVPQMNVEADAPVVEEVAPIEVAVAQEPQLEEREIEAPKEKPKEVYIKRRKEPDAKGPMGWLQAFQKAEATPDGAEVASITPAAGERSVPNRMPEPIDLLKTRNKAAPQMEASANSPQKAELIAPVDNSVPMLQGGEPALVSRAKDMDLVPVPAPLAEVTRPQQMALFEPKLSLAEPEIVPTSNSVAKPAVKPVAPEAELKVESLALNDVAPDAGTPTQAFEDDFLQQSIAAAQQEIQLARLDDRAVVTSSDAPPIARLAKALPTQEVQQPVTTSGLDTPYEPIVMPSYEPITNVEAVPPIAAAPIAPSMKIPQVEKVRQKPSVSPGIKVATPATAEAAPNNDAVAMAQALVPVASNAPKAPVMPNAADILSADAQAIIPIRTARSKDIFIARPDPAFAQDAPVAASPVISSNDVARNMARASSASKSDSVASAAPVSMFRQNDTGWEAKAGEDIKAVLSRWANKAGVDLVWQADKNGVVQQNLSVQGDLEGAVAALMAQNGDVLGLDGALQNTGAATYSAVSASLPQGMMREGTSLRQALQGLANSNGFELMWQSDRDYQLPRPVNTANAPLEATLASLLQQFEQNPVRPVGQFNADPVTGKKTLIIETERSL